MQETTTITTSLKSSNLSNSPVSNNSATTQAFQFQGETQAHGQHQKQLSPQRLGHKHTNYLLPAIIKAQRPQPFSPDRTDKLIEKQRVVKLLMVDDNCMLQEMLMSAFTELVGEYRIQFLQAYNGVMGLRLLLEERPQIVLLDINLPGMSGPKIVAALQESQVWQEEGYRPRLLGLTGLIEAKPIEKLLEMGLEHCFTKPFSIVALLERVRLMVAQEAYRRECCQPSRPAPL